MIFRSTIRFMLTDTATNAFDTDTVCSCLFVLSITNKEDNSFDTNTKRSVLSFELSVRSIYH